MPYTLEEEQKTLLIRYLSIPFDAVLTVNYSYEVECALDTTFNLKKESPSKYRKSTQKGSKPQEQLGLFKYFTVNNQNIWHIHGEAARPSSMVMGHYYYGKLLSEIQKRIPYVIKAYKSSMKQGTPFIPKSWIDYFLLGNVYIVGFGMDPSEMDIWWLVNCKKRHFKGCGNIYFYEPNLDEPKNYAVRALVDTLGISTFTQKVNNGQKFREYYELLPSEIQKKMF
ncbi:hypothetical protein [Butyrivibrio sp. LC3010]|uniref:hypothetical protein n=1 Tax=Butyrivibrio sp. LC3010 TaxID=1280680 RepID=UPI00040C0C7E|nr:hypothetical protein [Butyrivibrio sp. LC3010]